MDAALLKHLARKVAVSAAQLGAGAKAAGPALTLAKEIVHGPDGRFTSGGGGGDNGGSRAGDGRSAAAGKLTVSRSSSVAEDGKTRITVGGDLSDPDNVAALKEHLQDAAKELHAQTVGARSGAEWPVDLTLDLTGVTALSREGLGPVLALPRAIASSMPHVATVTVRAPEGDVASKLGFIGRLNTRAAREQGISFEVVPQHAAP